MNTGNGKADQTNKSARNLLNVTAYPVPYSDVTSSIKNICQVSTPL